MAEIFISNKNEPRNIKSLELGQQVRIVATATIEYGEDGVTKELIRTPIPKRQVIITGLYKKAEGTYVPGHKPRFYFEEWEGATLKVKNYVWLYQYKCSITDKGYFVHPDDIVEILKEPNCG